MGRNLLLVIVVCVAGAGCAVNEVLVAEETELNIAAATPDEAMLLDIGVVEFSAGIPEDNNPEKTGVYEEIRNAETRFLAYHLKTTLQQTGHWGAVRVIPGLSAFTDVIISGEIEKSDGEYVVLNISVDDATGRHWFRQSYETQTGMSSYSDRRDRRLDPYQKVFNDIANDLQQHVAGLSPRQLQQTRQVSELQFFADMSPLAFGQHLGAGEDGIAKIVRLPAANDPAVARLRQIRERDRLVVDTLNEHYANFYYGISMPYRSWRKNAREQAVNFREVKRSARLQALVGVVVLAGSLAIDTNSSSSRSRRVKNSLQNYGVYEGLNRVIAGFQRGREANLHLDAIAELSESFGAEAAPMVVNVQGQERRLTGTAAVQYESWRKLLREIYEAETGFSDAAEALVPVRAAETTQ